MLGPCWVYILSIGLLYVEIIFGLCYVYVYSMLGSYWVHVECMLGPCYVPVEFMLDLFWVYDGYMLNLCCMSHAAWPNVEPMLSLFHLLFKAQLLKRSPYTKKGFLWPREWRWRWCSIRDLPLSESNNVAPGWS